MTVDHDRLQPFRIPEETAQAAAPIAGELIVPAAVEMGAPTNLEGESAPVVLSAEAHELAAGSLFQAYRRILFGNDAAYNAARDEQARQLAKDRASFGTIKTHLDELYASFRHLAPDNLALARNSDYDFARHTRHVDLQHDTSEPEARLRQMIAEGTPKEGRLRWATDLSVLTAAASVRQYRGSQTHKQYKELASHMTVRSHAVSYVLANLNLFAQQGIEDLSGAELARHNLNQGHLETYKKLAELLPEDHIPELIQLDGPPLALTQLATDVRNRNIDSVMPYGLHTKLPGTPQAVIGQKPHIDKIIAAHDAYLMQRYGYENKPNSRTLSALAEIDLAERQHFLDAPTEEQYRTANRINSILAKVKRQQLPPDALAVYDRCRSITAIPKY